MKGQHEDPYELLLDLLNVAFIDSMRRALRLLSKSPSGLVLSYPQNWF